MNLRKALPRRTVLTASFAMLAARTAAAATTTGTVFTADELGGSVSALALPQGADCSARLPIAPHNVDIGADRASLLLVGAPPGGAHGAAGGRLLVLDATDIARAPLLNVAIGPHPAHVVPDADGIHAYVSDSHDGAVMVVDLRAGRIVARIPAGAEPHGLRLSPDGTELYVANMGGGGVSVVDVRRRRWHSRPTGTRSSSR